MKLLPYEPMSAMQILAMREILPALCAWLRAREHNSHPSH